MEQNLIFKVEKPTKPENKVCLCGNIIEPFFIEPIMLRGKPWLNTNRWEFYEECPGCLCKRMIEEEKNLDNKIKIEKDMQKEYIKTQRLNKSMMYLKQFKCIFKNEKSKIIDICKQFCAKPDCNLFIYGNPGLGKTHLLSCMANEIMKTKDVMFFRMIDFIKIIREKMFEASAEADNFIERIVNDNSVLFFDDIGAEKPTETVKEKIYSLIDLCILQERKGIVITSNLSIKDLANHFGNTGDRIASRIEELCQVYQLSGENKRLIKNK